MFETRQALENKSWTSFGVRSRNAMKAFIECAQAIYGIFEISKCLEGIVFLVAYAVDFEDVWFHHTESFKNSNSILQGFQNPVFIIDWDFF